MEIVHSINGVKEFTINTGRIFEEQNIMISEMLLSKKVYLIIRKNGVDDIYSVSVKDNKIDFINRTIGKNLIGYTFNFEVDTPYINNN
jgi:hypothetical protein